MKTALEAVLQAMVTGGWANESDGNVYAPMGHFARVSNEENEIASIIDAFGDVMETYGMGYVNHIQGEHELTDVNVLIGHFLVGEDSYGNVLVTRYDNPIQLTRDFQQLQDDFAEWNKD
jgi:hypothetical protein